MLEAKSLEALFVSPAKQKRLCRPRTRTGVMSSSTIRWNCTAEFRAVLPGSAALLRWVS